MQGSLDDVSTIGWENESVASSVVQSNDQKEFNPELGELSVDDIEEDKRRYQQEHALIVDGHKCPDSLVEHITPMEFEEIVNLFVQFDADGSGTIDKHEIKKVLHFLGLEFSAEKADELMDIIDADKSGEIDFDEFCQFVVMIKKGDARVGKFHSLLDKLNSTPLGELERQATSRGLKLRFLVSEVRAATLTTPTIYVLEVQLTGLWHRVENGDVISTFSTRKYQGFGQSTREAKYNAASNAIVNLGDAMPGVRYARGEIPEDWARWVDDNLLRGVDAGKIVSILASKGFHPHLNTALMHRILSWYSLVEFLRAHPELDVTDDESLMNDDFLDWLRQLAIRGIDGAVLLQLLQDRFIDLKREHALFAQQLRNNELGSLQGKNGKRAQLLDFWHCCKMGYADFVEIYCKCGVDVNETVLDSQNGERVSALWYAAYGGSAEVVKLLLQFGANVNILDRRGRNCVHVAALHGNQQACCELIAKGGRIFGRDLQGNTPLHLAALANQTKVVDYLAERGQELARFVYTDKVRPRKSSTFDELIAEIFEKLPQTKLQQQETVRFEKSWLHDAAILFFRSVDQDVRFMVPLSCKEIMEDVLTRFDPRPETGIFVTDAVNGEQYFIRTIPAAAELGVLLKYVLRQAAVDMINNWRRTALHFACDANKIKSHEPLILLLVDKYGCNVNLVDMHRRRAVDLLIQDKVMRDQPSSTQAREEVLMTRREDNLKLFFERIAAEDRLMVALRRETILQECIQRQDMMDERLWVNARQASVLKSKFNNGEWEMYEDPDTGNSFYCRIPLKKPASLLPFVGLSFIAPPTTGKTRQSMLMSGIAAPSHDSYHWLVPPPESKAFVDRTNGLQYLRTVKSERLRVYGQWEVLRCKRTFVEYYYNTITEELRFFAPEEMQWRAVLRESTRQPVVLGYAQDWWVYLDKHGNTFYRNRFTRYCEYDQAPDAKEMKPSEKLCSFYQHKNEQIRQKWYTCEQCNRGWKMAMAERSMQQVADSEAGGEESESAKPRVNNSNRTLTLCEPCIARCHANHKGVKFLYTALSSRSLNCMCAEISKFTRSLCSACVVSEEQMRTQRYAEQFKQEQRRKRQLNYDYPPILACVPRFTRSGRPKTLSGWTICRICKPVITDKHGEEVEVENEFDADTMKSDDDLSDESELTSDEEEQMSKGGDMDSPQRPLLIADASATPVIGDEDSQAQSSASKSKDKVLNQSHGASMDEMSVSTKEATVAESLDRLLKGKEEHRRRNLSKKRIKYPDHKMLQSKTMESMISLIGDDGWVQVLDAEEPEELKFNDIVMCERHGGLLKHRALIKAQVQPGFYRVRYENTEFGDEVLNRGKLEVFTRQKFWFNVFTGQSAWSREEIDLFHRLSLEKQALVPVNVNARGHIQGDSSPIAAIEQQIGRLSRPESPELTGNIAKVFESQSQTLDGVDWHELYAQSSMRRGFERYDEMIHDATGLIFYVEHDLFQREKSCLLLQRLYRQKHWKAKPFLPFSSLCFQFDLPESVRVMKRALAGWAHLRRRSKNVGDFLDTDGLEWEEYMDSKTSEFFYWQEEENMYRWEKPPLFQKRVYDSNKQIEFKVGDDCMFLFPGHRKEEVAVVTRVRFDDETNEPLYDIQHKYNANMIIKLVQRMRVKQVPLEGDELKFAKLETTWRNVIKRRREMDERARQREKTRKLQEEMKMLEQLGSRAFLVQQQREQLLEDGGAPPQLPQIEEGSPRNSPTQAMLPLESAISGRPQIVISETTRLMKSRMERIALEAQIVREELEEMEGRQRREKVQQQLAEFKQQHSGDGRPLTRAGLISLTRSIEMKLVLEEKIEKRNALQKELDAKKEQTHRRVVELDNYLRDQEITMTTPRSLNRRRLARRIHIAMKRQSDCYIICEWGCGDWFRVGVEQQDHQLRRCVKRILPCVLGCPLKNTEEHWLSPHESTRKYHELKNKKKELVKSLRNQIQSKKNKMNQEDLDKEDEMRSSIGVQRSKLLDKVQNADAVDERMTRGDLMPDFQSPSVGLSTLEDQLIVAENMKLDAEDMEADLRQESLLERMQRQEASDIGEMTVQQHHETMECPKRLVMCPLQCLEWVCAEQLEVHMKDLCTKRPAEPIYCRLGCGMSFGGLVEQLLEAEDDRMYHEEEECEFRSVRCNWTYEDGKVCAAQMKASERAAHRDYHLTSMGVITHCVPGTYTFSTHSKSVTLKVQIWGAGGGSGYFYGRSTGNGGGGGFVEAIVDIEPYSVLELTVGSGGSAGVRGKSAIPLDIHELRRQAALRREKEKALPRTKLKVTLADLVKDDPALMQSIDATSKEEFDRCESAEGGKPGGGTGYSGNECWACGGGGGYSSITKKTARGVQLLLLASGGGGAASLHGLAGGGLDGVLAGTLVDPLNGSTASVNTAGIAGETGSTFNSRWPAQAGEMWQGGHGCEFGGGGGGGYFGGGGGGTSPGIGGGGGGGSCYVYQPMCRDVVVIQGHDWQGGGLNNRPPLACGVGEWDKTGGHVGEGGRGDEISTNPGKNGCIRIFKTGFY